MADNQIYKQKTGGTAGEVENVTNLFFIDTLADLAGYLNAGTYELPSGHYIFTSSIDFGTADIVLMDLNGCYFFRGLCVNITLTFSGVSSFVSDNADGIILQWENMFVDTPNGSAFSLTQAGNSLIIELVVFLNSAVQSVVDGYDFLTTKYLISIASVTGFLANNVGTISCQVPQYNSGQNIAGTFLTVSGVNSERLTVSDVDSRPESNESMFDIQANYGGLISMTGGVHSGTGGSYFKAGSRVHTDPDVDVNNIKNVQSSANIAFGFQTGNATETVIGTSGVPVKINAVWGDPILSRFTVNANGTWTYIGDEDISVGASLICTVDAAGGGTKTMSAYLAKNGTFIPTSKGENAGSSGIQISAAVLIPLVTNDTIEAFVANDSDTSNLIVTTCTINIGGG